MKKKRQYKALAYKDNFWSKLRVEANLTIKEVASAIGRHEGIVGMWFSGQIMPSDTDVRSLCSLFDVDFNEGQLAFQHAHLGWKAEHNQKTVKYSGAAKAPTEKTEKITIGNLADVILTLYGKVGCEDFLLFYNAVTSGKGVGEEVIKSIYGKVNFETYNKILEIIKEV